MTRVADEDTTLLGEQLSALGRETDGLALDAQTSRDYQGALDAYEAAKRAVPRLTRAAEFSAVVDTLSTGRYLMACVRANVDGQRRPELRTPCFFNPQHGPSVRDVRYTIPGGHGTRTVPACAQDAARVESGERPEIREVRVGQTVASYGEAGEAVVPYGKGWFTTGILGAEAHRRENQYGIGGS